MAAVPQLLRRVLVANMPDPDWGAAQAAPSASICATVTGVRTVVVVARMYTAAGVIVNPSGTIDLQPIEVATTLPAPGAAAITLVRTGAADLGVAQGVGLTYAIAGLRLFTLRVVAHALAGTVVYVDLYWAAVE